MVDAEPTRVGVVLGTRPEVIKLAPVVHALERHSPRYEPVVISTGQHRQLLDQLLALFGITPEVDLDLMVAGPEAQRPRGPGGPAHR